MSDKLKKAAEEFLKFFNLEKGFTGHVTVEINLKDGEVRNIHQREGRRKING